MIILCFYEKITKKLPILMIRFGKSENIIVNQMIQTEKRKHE
jgi:hypothetical protein